LIVLDASAAVELVLRTDRGTRVADRLAADGGPVIAPHLIDPEVMQAVRDLLRLRQIDAGRAQSALAAFVAFPLQRVPHDVLWERMWALRQNLTAYDATYVALAELANSTLVTCDGPLARRPGHSAMIELL
jgi:predicted nucleic acid-binding protein